MRLISPVHIQLVRLSAKLRGIASLSFFYFFNWFLNTSQLHLLLFASLFSYFFFFLFGIFSDGLLKFLVETLRHHLLLNEVCDYSFQLFSLVSCLEDGFTWLKFEPLGVIFFLFFLLCIDGRLCLDFTLFLLFLNPSRHKGFQVDGMLARSHMAKGHHLLIAC